MATARITERLRAESGDHFKSFYVHCRQAWQDVWSCMCNDKCPVCNREIEPYASQASGESKPDLLVPVSWSPEGGLPEGLERVEELPGWP